MGRPPGAADPRAALRLAESRLDGREPTDSDWEAGFAGQTAIGLGLPPIPAFVLPCPRAAAGGDVRDFLAEHLHVIAVPAFDDAIACARSPPCATSTSPRPAAWPSAASPTPSTAN